MLGRKKYISEEEALTRTTLLGTLPTEKSACLVSRENQISKRFYKVLKRKKALECNRKCSVLLVLLKH
jgi:hypothetical protein